MAQGVASQNATPYTSVPNAQALAILKRSGALDDPGMAAFVKQHGPSVALAASEGRGGYGPSNIVDAGYQANYNAMPWYQKAAIGIGHGMEDSYDALKGSALTIGNKIGLVSGKTLGDYKEGVADNQAKLAPILNAVARSNPASSFWWQWTGQNIPAIAAMAPGAGVALGERAGLTGLPLLLSRMGVGATEGGLYGAITPTQDQNYARNMTVGAITGGALPVAAHAAGVLGTGARDIVQFLGNKGTQENLAGTAMREALSGAAIPQAAPAVEGFQPTLGQLSNSPGIVQMERALRAKGDLGASLTAQEEANNAAIHSAIGKLAPETTPQAASAEARVALESERAAAKGAESQAWGQIPQGALFPTTDMKSAIESSLSKLPKAYRNLVPGEIPTLMQSLGDHETLPELQAARSRIGELASQARVSGDSNKARILSDLQSHVDAAIDPKNAVLGDGVTPAQFQDAYDTAMQSSRDLHARFDRKPIAQVLKQTATGPAVPSTQTLQAVLKNGNPEAVAQLSKAIGQNEDGRAAVRDYLVNAMRQYGATAKQDANGNAMISGAKLTKFLSDHDAAINEFMEPQQVQAVHEIAGAAKMNDNVMRGGARIGGSDTAAKLQHGNILSMLTHGAHVHGLFGLPGQFLGSLTSRVAAGAQGRLDEILTRAMSDPEYADMLMQKATPGNLQRFMSGTANHLRPFGWGALQHYLITGGNAPTTTGAPWPRMQPALVNGNAQQ